MCLPREDINHILSDHLKSNNYEFISCESLNTEDVSIGFLSSQGKICIKFRFEGKIQKLHIFIKTLPQSLYHRQKIIFSGGFHREVELYNKLLNNFHELIVDNTIPKCYLARSDDIVVLEDLTFKGFKNKNVFEPLDLLHCKKTLETIAKFHAASFIMEKTAACKIDELVPVIKKEVVMSKDNKTYKRAFKIGTKTLKKITEIYLAHYPIDLINKAFQYMESVGDKMKSSELYPNVLSHSDLWLNNIMFRYDDNGKLMKACILDFQIATYKAPSFDIQLFLHTCTDRELRDRHYYLLLRHYFHSLGVELSFSDVSINDIMTWNDFENMLKETLPVIITLSPLFLHFVLMPPDIMKGIMKDDDKFKYYMEEDRTDSILLAMQENEHYKQRLLQAMTEFFNFFNSN
ncbi:uncharacterized protein [Halyomorpha halys]|uniref:uncharacterized protein n=1 Tax=Halyomorpha halys TaxID=286706 RepID=UPI0006D5253C|nr:uncharacterized protein LOC106685118 [Halyomorpha halys]